MTLTRDEVRRVADLARLDLTVEEENRFAVQLGRVVEYIGQLERYEAGGPGGAAMRSLPAGDVPAASLPTETVLANAPERFGPFVAVPRILETDD